MKAVRTYTAQVMRSLKAINFHYILSVKNMSFVCLFVCFIFRHLKITFDSEQPRLKEKRIILSLRWNKKFWTFVICVQFFTFVGRAELKRAFILLLVVYGCLFTYPDLLPLQNQLYLILVVSQRPSQGPVIKHSLMVNHGLATKLIFCFEDL